MTRPPETVAPPLTAVSDLESSRWMRAGGVYGVLGIVLVLYFPGLVSLTRFWNDNVNKAYTHGYLIALICLWLLVRIRPHLQRTPWVTARSMLPAVAAAGLASLIAYRAGILFACQILLPILCWSSVYAACGREAARLCAFPLGYFYFAVPVWGVINPLAQWSTVFAVRLLLRACGIPAYFNANFVQVPAGVFEIAGGCSGLHFIVVGLAIAVLYGELRSDVLRDRIKLGALAILLAAVANWIRVFSIILVGHFTDMQGYLVRVSHYAYGWWIFAGTMVAFFLIVHRYFPEPPTALNSTSAESPPAVPPDSPVRQTQDLVYLGSASATVLVLMLAPLWHLATNPATRTYSEPPQMLVPMAGAWAGPIPGRSEWQPVFEGADRVERGWYLRREDSRGVQAFVALYYWQAYSRKLGGYENSVVGGGELQSRETGVGEAKKYEQLRVTDDGQRESLIWYAYSVGNHHFTSALRAQLWYGVESLYSAPLSKVTAFKMECVPDCAAAQRALAEVTSAPGLQAAIGS